MEACAICGDVRFIVLRRSSHTTAPTHLLQHLFAVVAQRLAGVEDDRSLGLRAGTYGKARLLHAHEHVRSAHDMVRPQSPLLLLRTLSMKAAACLMMMWVRSSRTQMMTRKIMRHKVTYTIKVHGQGGASKCLDVLRASTIELSQRAIRNK